MPNNEQPIDGLSPPAPPPAPAPATPQNAASIKKLEFLLLVGASILYLLYILSAFALMAFLPSADQAMQPLVSVGLGVAALAGLIFLAFGGVLLMHIAQSKTDIKVRK